MNDRRDPMALWVGDWTPEDVIDRETRRLREDREHRENERERTARETE